MNIDIRFVCEPKLLSRAIAWFGGDLGYSHVGAIVSGPERPAWWPTELPYDGTREYELGARLRANRSLTGQAGVQLRPADYARFTRVDTVRVPATAAQVRAFWAVLARQLGRPYSVRTILGFVLGEELHDRGRWDCSTVLAWALVEAGLLPEALRPHLQQLTPNALWVALTALAWRRR